MNKVINPGFLLLATIVAVTFVFVSRHERAMKQAEKKLTAQELKDFNDNFKFSKDRTAMPTRFDAIATAFDMRRRGSLYGVIAIIACLLLVIFRGPQLWP